MERNGAFIHASARAQERYGLALTHELHDLFLDKARTGTRASLQYHSRKSRRYLFKIRHGRRAFFIMTNEAIDAIITFLPPDDPLGAEKERAIEPCTNHQ